MIALKYNPRLGRWLFIVFSLALGLYFLYRVRVILPPFVLAIVLAYVLNPLVRFLEIRKLPRIWGILLVYLMLGTLIGLAGVYFIPILIGELDNFANALPIFVSIVNRSLGEINETYRNIIIPESIRQALNDIINRFEQSLLLTVRQQADGLIGLLSSLVGLVLVPVLAFYILKDLRYLEKKILHWLPRRHRKTLLKLWRKVDNVLVKFVRGHLLVATIVGILTGIGLSILGVKFPLLLGIVAGTSDLVPYFGPIIGGVPAVLIALLHSKYQALYVMILILLVQQLECNLVSPRILGDSVGLHPVIVVFVLLAGGYLYGILGMIVAVPLAAILRLVFNYFYDQIQGGSGID